MKVTKEEMDKEKEKLRNEVDNCPRCKFEKTLGIGTLFCTKHNERIKYLMEFEVI